MGFGFDERTRWIMSPGNRLTRFSPIFPVSDLHRALAHYRSPGFVTTAYDDGDEYGFADRDGTGLHLAAESEHDPGVGSAATYLYVEDADALHAEWSRPGVGGITRPVEDTAYELREGSHVDLDGNLIRFGSPMKDRSVAERLRAHLEVHHGIEVSGVTELDQGVFRVDRHDGPSWVARRFPPTRPLEAASGDAAILRFLADHDFPAERCAAPEPVSVLEGQAVLVTEHVEAVPRDQRRAAIRDDGGLPHLGELLGRLHTLPAEAGAVSRSGGAWHHLTEGLPGDEVAAGLGLLAQAEGLVPSGQRDAYESMGTHLETLDSCEGLPQALIHPDFVLANVIASPGRGMVVVDWTGAGRGPRLWSLAFLLLAEGAKDLRRIDRVIAGYRRHVTLEPEELTRLSAVARARPVIFATWAFCMGRRSATDAAREMAASAELAEAVGARARVALTAEHSG
jgi:Ser/Thr protein kinase RdoA (MazF antagonist)